MGDSYRDIVGYPGEAAAGGLAQRAVQSPRLSEQYSSSGDPMVSISAILHQHSYQKHGRLSRIDKWRVCRSTIRDLACMIGESVAEIPIRAIAWGVHMEDYYRGTSREELLYWR